MKCCGEIVLTAFCPNCGREVGGDPLIQIHTHILGLLNRAEAGKKSSLEWEQDNPDRVNEHRHKIQRAAGDRKIAKYKRWAKAIETVINKKK